MKPTQDDPQSSDEATHGSGIRNADHGIGSDRQQLRRSIRRIPIQSDADKPATAAEPAAKK